MWYQPGDLLRVTIMGLVQHEGIVTESGSVVSNSKKRGAVVEESPRAFAGGHTIENIGRLGNLPSDQIIANARARIGRRYSLYNYNCQHFVRDCYGLGRKSPQKRWLVGAGVAAAAAILIL